MNEEIKFNKEEAKKLAEFVELTDSIMTKQAEENATLQAELDELKKNQPSEKQAGDDNGETREDESVLAEEKIAATVDNLIEAGFAVKSEREDLVKHFKEPENCLNALDKIAEMRTKQTGTMPRMGKVAGAGTASAAEVKRNSDVEFERRFG